MCIIQANQQTFMDTLTTGSVFFLLSKVFVFDVSCLLQRITLCAISVGNEKTGQQPGRRRQMLGRASEQMPAADVCLKRNDCLITSRYRQVFFLTYALAVIFYALSIVLCAFVIL